MVLLWLHKCFDLCIITVMGKKPRVNHQKQGFSMIELLVAIALVAILLIILFLSLTKQTARSRDAERKSDLERIKVAFEDYYNDNSCYPPPDV
jgi:prepilin-type N-terminal cleavage/methylation domain-containing protein